MDSPVKESSPNVSIKTTEEEEGTAVALQVSDSQLTASTEPDDHQAAIGEPVTAHQQQAASTELVHEKKQVDIGEPDNVHQQQVNSDENVDGSKMPAATQQLGDLHQTGTQFPLEVSVQLVPPPGSATPVHQETSERSLVEEEKDNEDTSPPGQELLSQSQRPQRIRKNTDKGLEYNLTVKKGIFRQHCIKVRDTLTNIDRELSRARPNLAKLQQYKEELSLDRKTLQTSLSALLKLQDCDEAKAQHQQLEEQIQPTMSSLVLVLKPLSLPVLTTGGSTSGKPNDVTKTSVSSLTKGQSTTTSRTKKCKSMVSGLSNPNTVHAHDSVSNTGKAKTTTSHGSDKASIIVDALATAAALKVKKLTFSHAQELKDELDRLRQSQEEEKVSKEIHKEAQRVIAEHSSSEQVLKESSKAKRQQIDEAQQEEDRKNLEAEIELQQTIALAAFKQQQDSFKAQEEERIRAQKAALEEEEAREEERLRIRRAERQKREDERRRQQEEEDAIEEARLRAKRAKQEEEIAKEKQRRQEQDAQLEMQRLKALAQIEETQRTLRTQHRLKALQRQAELDEAKAKEERDELIRKANQVKIDAANKAAALKRQQELDKMIAKKTEELEMHQIDSDLAIQTAIVNVVQAFDEDEDSFKIPQLDVLSLLQNQKPLFSSFSEAPKSKNSLPSADQSPQSNDGPCREAIEQTVAAIDKVSKTNINVSACKVNQSSSSQPVNSVVKDFSTTLTHMPPTSKHQGLARTTLWIPPDRQIHSGDGLRPAHTMPEQEQVTAVSSSLQAKSAARTFEYEINEDNISTPPGHVLSSSSQIPPQAQISSFTYQGTEYVPKSTLSPHATVFDPLKSEALSPQDARESRGGHAESEHEGSRRTEARVSQQTDDKSQSIADILLMSRMPLQEPSKFSGDPIEYPEWKASFHLLIERQKIPETEKLLYLKRYLEGTAKDSIKGFLLINNDNAYHKAMQQLEERFGNPFIVSQAFRTKLDGWAAIKNKDVAAVREFSDFLQQCLVAITKVGGLDILNDAHYQKTLVEKLPEWMKNRWMREVAKTKAKEHRYPNFEEFATFIAVESSISNDPLYSKSEPTSAGAPNKPQQRDGVKRHAMATETDNETVKCSYCDLKNHKIEECRSFKRLTAKERADHVFKHKMCYRCLKATGHTSKQCKEKNLCEICQRRHHTCMHDENFVFRKPQNEKNFKSLTSMENNTSSADTDSTKVKEVSANQTANAKIDHLTSMIVPVYLSCSDNPGKEMLIYAFLDTASDSTFVTQTLAENLGAKYEATTLNLSTVSDDSKRTRTKKFRNLRVRAVSSQEYVMLPETYAVKKLSANVSHIPTKETAAKCPDLKHLESNFHPLHQNSPIGLLIGYDCPEALMPLNRVGERPYAIETKLGWSIVGPTPASPSNSVGTSHHVHTEADAKEAEDTSHVNKIHVQEASATDIMHVLERDFVDIEEGTLSQDDIKFLKIAKETIHVNEEGHYEMSLPFREDNPHMPDNRESVRRRTIGLMNQFRKNPKKHQDYRTFMNEIIKRGDAELIPENEIDRESRWYIPHHGVYHPKKPDKIRVVFDCSAEYQDSCLNDLLLQGPDLINSLNGVLCRFRKGPIAFCCDVEKMYHQFHVTEHHRDYLRFLWWEDGDTTKPLQDYRMKVHIFGAKSSPGCANYCLKQIAKDNEEIHPESSDFLQRNFYVDDGLQASETVTEAVTTLKKAREICEKGNLRLHKITSNSEALKTCFPKSEVTETKLTELSNTEEVSNVERTLGLQWNTDEDTLSFNSDIKTTPDTRRGVLSTIASLYDPLGLLSPFILQGKQILQEICCESLDWDTPLPEDLQCKWRTWLKDLAKVGQAQIPRNVHPTFFSPTEVELHHFSDASTSGYGQCSYIKFKGPEMQTHTALMMAKSRVVPKKGVTVPRLELQAAVLSIKVARFLQEELDYSNVQHYFWTDSQIVLAYIRNKAKRFHIFVANRIHQILKFSKSDQWNYVPTEMNPADHASRGMNIEDLVASDWFSGPELIRSQHLPTEDAFFEIPSDDKEVKHCKATSSSEISTTSFEDRIRRFSTKEGLIRAFSLIIAKCEMKHGRQHSKIELHKLTEQRLIRCVQQEAFSKCAPSTQKTLNILDAKKDQKGILRVSGRLENSLEDEEVKHPIILPGQGHLSVLIARYSHEKVGHQRRTTTMSDIRRRGYWILSLRKVVRHVIKECIPCIKRYDPRESQKMADLPRTRVEEAAPFTHCGLDCFGPFHVKDGRKEVKRYGLVVTCMPTRAIHLEVLDDMSTDAFINGLRNVIAIRGSIRTIQCDRGTNFIGAHNELNAAKRNMTKKDKDTVISEMLRLQCEFKFNPPAASHMGGVWERQIRTVRNVLSGLMVQHGSRLSTSSLRTLLYEVMAIVNGRPLTVESLDCPDGPLPLTPNHLLTMKPTVIPPPPGDFEDADIVARSQWRRTQRIAEEFWRRWRDEYLFTLQPRRIWRRPRRNIMVNDVVILRDINECRSDWKLARVEQTFPSKDGLVRSVQVILPNTSLNEEGKASSPSTRLTRPVQKLTVLIPASESTDCAHQQSGNQA